MWEPNRLEVLFPFQRYENPRVRLEKFFLAQRC